MFPRLYKALSPAIAPRIHPISITVNRQHRPTLGSQFSNQASSSTGPSIAQIRTMASQEIIDEAINGHQVTIFSKTYCPYCKRAKGLFAQEYKDAEVKILELDELDEGSAIQDALEKMTGQRSVPNIFINKKHVGGCDKVVSLHSQGKVAGLLSA